MAYRTYSKAISNKVMLQCNAVDPMAIQQLSRTGNRKIAENKWAIIVYQYIN